MSYLVHNMAQVSFEKMLVLLIHCSEMDMLDPDRAPIELSGVCPILSAARRAFDKWVAGKYPSLYDDLVGQYSQLDLVPALESHCENYTKDDKIYVHSRD
jgi:hypothetical protein